MGGQTQDRSECYEYETRPGPDTKKLFSLAGSATQKRDTDALVEKLRPGGRSGDSDQERQKFVLIEPCRRRGRGV